MGRGITGAEALEIMLDIKAQIEQYDEAMRRKDPRVGAILAGIANALRAAATNKPAISSILEAT